MDQKYLIINDFLPEDFAEELYTYIRTRTAEDWFYYYKYGKEEKPVLFDTSAEDNRERKDLEPVLTESLQSGEFTYTLKRLKKFWDVDMPTGRLRGDLRDPEFLQLLTEFSGIHNLELVEDFCSIYDEGDFLSIHPDPNFDIAFILNLSKDWKYEYGGCLTVFDQERPTVILPEFNSLVLMFLGDDGVDHYISEVSSRAPDSRIAVSGWFNRKENSS